ncbi:MAG: riboflavin synthase [Aquificaceae bacterium]
MFTGLVEDIGVVKGIELSSKGSHIKVQTNLKNIKIGDSISVNGVCLTVVSIAGDILSFDVSSETLRRSNIKLLKEGDRVNLERALKLGDRLGGHILQGHVDFTSKVIALEKLGEHWTLKIEIPKDWSLYFVEKGSVGIDGISLTVNSVQERVISINIIPHTYLNTNLSYRRQGSYVNVEVDLIGKYVINYLQRRESKGLGELLRDYLE